MKKATIFIDESGTLSDPKDKVVIVAAVGIQTPVKLLLINKSIRKSQQYSTSELKFYRAGERTKKRFLKKLSQEDIEIFILVVEKEGKKIDDTPEHFALLCWLMLEDCLVFYQEGIKEVIFDRHFHQKRDQESFNQTLFKLLGKEINVSHVDSQKDQRVNAADMIAGSALWEKTGKDARFYQLIKPKIMSEKLVNWKQVKKRFWAKKMSEPAQAPIQTIKNSIRHNK